MLGLCAELTLKAQTTEASSSPGASFDGGGRPTDKSPAEVEASGYSRTLLEVDGGNNFSGEKDNKLSERESRPFYLRKNHSNNEKWYALLEAAREAKAAEALDRTRDCSCKTSPETPSTSDKSAKPASEREAVIPNLLCLRCQESERSRIVYTRPIPPSDFLTRSGRYTEPDDFTPEEHAAYLQEFARYPKFFDIISQSKALAGRSTKDCIEHYYNTKMSTGYKQRKDTFEGLSDAQPTKESSCSLRQKPLHSCQTLAEAAKESLEGLLSEQRNQRFDGKPPCTSTLRYIAGEKKRKEVREEMEKTLMTNNAGRTEAPRACTHPTSSKSSSNSSSLTKPSHKRKSPDAKEAIVSELSERSVENLSTTYPEASQPSRPARSEAAPQKRRRVSDETNDASTPTSSPTDRSNKPTHPYMLLIAMSIMDAPKHRLPLNQIYRWISSHFPYYKTQAEDPKWFKSWSNSIRHNLSVNAARFEKRARLDDEERSHDDNGKGDLWIVRRDTVEGQKLLALIDEVNASSSASEPF